MNAHSKVHASRQAAWLAALALSATSLPGVAGEFVSVAYPGAVVTSLNGLSNSGTATGYAVMADDSQFGFTYDLARGTFTLLPTPPGGYPFAALGINQRGTLVGPLSDTPVTAIGAILQKQGQYTTFDVPGFANDVPRAVADSGLVTGYAESGVGNWTGFTYDPKKADLTLFTVPGSVVVIPQGINSRGVLVGSAVMPPNTVFPGSLPGQYGFVRNPAGAITLFRVNDGPTRARGISDAGLMTGSVQDTSGVAVGFTAPRPASGAYVNLVVPGSAQFSGPGALSTIPQAIDNTGRVVGVWVDADGNNLGFVYLPD